MIDVVPTAFALYWVTNSVLRFDCVLTSNTLYNPVIKIDGAMQTTILSQSSAKTSQQQLIRLHFVCKSNYKTKNYNLKGTLCLKQ